LLEDEAETSSRHCQLVGIQLAQVSTVERNGSASRSNQADDRLEQHGLSAAALSDDGKRLTSGHLQVDMAQHPLLPEMDLKVAQADQGLRIVIL
jgi:hypothetical protein